MHKNEFIRQVARESGVPQAIVGQVLGAAIRVIGRSLIAGQKVVWTGFGTFEMRRRSQRRGINPQTGEQITIGATLTPGFTASTALKRRVTAAADATTARLSSPVRAAPAEKAPDALVPASGLPGRAAERAELAERASR